MVLDRDYVLYAVGLLAESHPGEALAIFNRHLLPSDHAPHHTHDHVHLEGAEHGHSCCS